ncbi:MAG: toll/interleukin-1 receptor domain-containing protein [Verrucomicrobiales bacterium]|nr:toll/interleukin-1 receptor domain-containing protein [Verrucomicrobiales bacterium]
MPSGVGRGRPHEANLTGPTSSSRAQPNQYSLTSRGRELGHAILHASNFERANLTEAALTMADLSKANLSAARLMTADLGRASLSGVNLTGADLTGARLGLAIHQGTNLQGADLTGVELHATIFALVDLRACVGLEKVVHRGPSTIGLDTLRASRGRIPEVFLRGCGVPDIFLQYVASLAGKAIAFCSVFISYSSKDQELAKRLHKDLQARGVRCWFAPEDLKIGDQFSTEVDRAIRLHDKLLLLLSADSLRSAWVEHEVREALEREKEQGQPVLSPIQLDDALKETTQQWAYELRLQRHIGDFTGWKNRDAYQNAIGHLLRDLKVNDA